MRLNHDQVSIGEHDKCATIRIRTNTPFAQVGSRKSYRITPAQVDPVLYGKVGSERSARK